MSKLVQRVKLSAMTRASIARCNARVKRTGQGVAEMSQMRDMKEGEGYQRLLEAVVKQSFVDLLGIEEKRNHPVLSVYAGEWMVDGGKIEIAPGHEIDLTKRGGISFREACAWLDLDAQKLVEKTQAERITQDMKELLGERTRVTLYKRGLE